MSKDDGGSAFPLPIALNDVGNIVTSDEYARVGMTMRDYFAAKAMQALFANPSPPSISWSNYSEAETTVEECAGIAYQIADAMLKERTR